MQHRVGTLVFLRKRTAALTRDIENRRSYPLGLLSQGRNGRVHGRAAPVKEFDSDHCRVPEMPERFCPSSQQTYRGKLLSIQP
jgi:hypothetical protein